MHWRLDIRGWRFYIALTHSVRAKGVNSRLPDGRHILLWDFDNVEGKEVLNALETVQKRFKLSRIFILNTGLDRHFHAYCFRAVDWASCLFYLVSTPYLDKTYLKIGVIRGFFTLRYSKKEGREFTPAIILPSKVKEDIDPFSELSGMQYWTKRL